MGWWPFSRKNKGEYDCDTDTTESFVSSDSLSSDSSDYDNENDNENDGNGARMVFSGQQFRAGHNPRPNDKFIAIMGVTGSGKSSFISLLTGGQAKVGSGLEAYTRNTDVYAYTFAPGQTVYLIDTPGFNDTYRDDTKILVEITSWLTSSYNNKVNLNGVIYLHDITQGRMFGSALKTLKTFKELSGPDAMQKVALVTTHWDIVALSTRSKCEDKEKQLIQDERFWGSMIRRGSWVRRHDNTQESADKLIRSIVRQSHVTLAVQSQMVDENLKLSQTGAGRSLGMDLARQMESDYKEQLEHVKQLRLDKKRSDAAREAAQKEFRRELDRMRKQLEVTSRELNERMQRELAAKERKIQLERERHHRERVRLRAQRETGLSREDYERQNRGRQTARWQMQISEEEEEEEEDSWTGSDSSSGYEPSPELRKRPQATNIRHLRNTSARTPGRPKNRTDNNDPFSRNKYNDAASMIVHTGT
ncbi:hypothetical protein N7481_007090 [Penicillium waksmanii]|uniref:uncharacterized protein n=1 Tax=Penicillium waksmanii TaxID=69791 RepID=UPI002546FF23|nr:uncharacterized protein N7481_007090 [Penicillium waksmanii]KAJ5979792.1 hypothetical protein N7481_007090 [Penicillium waksmanii]